MAREDIAASDQPQSPIYFTPVNVTFIVYARLFKRHFANLENARLRFFSLWLGIQIERINKDKLESFIVKS